MIPKLAMSDLKILLHEQDGRLRLNESMMDGLLLQVQNLFHRLERLEQINEGLRERLKLHEEYTRQRLEELQHGLR